MLACVEIFKPRVTTKYFARLVFIRAKNNDWLVMLVWLRVKAVLLSYNLVSELMDLKVINKLCF